MRTSLTVSEEKEPTKASGSEATLVSQMILPAPSTMQSDVSSKDTSKPAYFSMVVLRRVMLGAGAHCGSKFSIYRGTTTRTAQLVCADPLPHLSNRVFTSYEDILDRSTGIAGLTRRAAGDRSGITLGPPRPRSPSQTSGPSRAIECPGVNAPKRQRNS
jgi:hypothetical protein